MTIQMGLPLANDHPDGLAFCKWSSGCAGFLQMIIRISSFQQDSSPFFIFSKFLIFFQQTSSSKHFFFFFKSEDQGSISRTFLDQSVLVFFTSCAFFCGWESSVWAFMCIFQVSSTSEQGEVSLTWRSIFERSLVGRSIGEGGVLSQLFTPGHLECAGLAAHPWLPPEKWTLLKI